MKISALIIHGRESKIDSMEENQFPQIDNGVTY
jgi:hypothetical protein